MKKALPIVIFCLAVLFTAMSVIFYDEKIPELKIKCQNEIYKIEKFPFSWRTLTTGYQKDYVSPPELAEDMPAIEVSPNSMIHFSFSKNPSYIDVSLWNDNAESYEGNETGISAPAKKGTYVFAVIGHWSKGQVLYVFKLEVR